MLKTYRIIPLVFILFLFGFTLITVSPVLAQSTQELESRIDILENTLCQLHPDAYSLDKRTGISTRLCNEESTPPPTADKDHFTYSPDGSIRQSPDGKFRCIGFPKVRSYPECKQKFEEAKERTKRLFHPEDHDTRFPSR